MNDKRIEDSLYYKRLLITRDKLLQRLLVLEAQVPQSSEVGSSEDTEERSDTMEASVREQALKKVRKIAEQLMSLNKATQEIERQESLEL
jgi:hypothetical protein